MVDPGGGLGNCTAQGCDPQCQHTSVGHESASIPTEGDLEQGPFTPSWIREQDILPGVEFQLTGLGPLWAEALQQPQTPASQPLGRPATQHPTTSVLTAAMSVYTLGAGITAAAGTRLALQLILITVFGLHPFQVPLATEDQQDCYSSSLPHQTVSALGNLRACCPPW